MQLFHIHVNNQKVKKNMFLNLLNLNNGIRIKKEARVTVGDNFVTEKKISIKGDNFLIMTPKKALYFKQYKQHQTFSNRQSTIHSNIYCISVIL
jgi:hypothetical protein